MADPYAPGIHLLIELRGASRLDDAALVERTLRAAAEACGATVLDTRVHGFGEGQGVTGVAILAESHLAIHTWPETGYAAADLFTCGRCDPHASVPVLKEAFGARAAEVREVRRG